MFYLSKNKSKGNNNEYNNNRPLADEEFADFKVLFGEYAERMKDITHPIR